MRTTTLQGEADFDASLLLALQFQFTITGCSGDREQETT